MVTCCSIWSPIWGVRREKWIERSGVCAGVAFVRSGCGSMGCYGLGDRAIANAGQEQAREDGGCGTKWAKRSVHRTSPVSEK